MENKNQTDPLLRARRLRAAGCRIHIPQDDGEARCMPSDGLRVYQTGGINESTAFDFGPSTGFKILLTITNNRPAFAISSFDLELPWKKTYLHWLEDPLVIDGSSRCYRFIGPEALEFPRSQVINHYADVTRTFSRGESVTGFLLAIGYDSIPAEFPHGMMIPAFVVIHDQFGGECRVPVELWADRMNKNRRRTPMGVRRKGGLLDKRDTIVDDT
jgi:hypothetical protein